MYCRCSVLCVAWPSGNYGNTSACDAGTSPVYVKEEFGCSAGRGSYQITMRMRTSDEHTMRIVPSPRRGIPLGLLIGVQLCLWFAEQLSAGVVGTKSNAVNVVLNPH